MRAGAFIIGTIMLLVAGITNASDTLTLYGNHPPDAERQPSLGDADPAMALSMDLRFAPRNQSQLNQLLADQQNPASSNFHHWLKPGEYDQRFGAKQSDIDAVAQWLKDEGFAVQSTSSEDIRFSGTVAQAERAFATRIERFGDGNTYANIEDPSIPGRFAGIVTNISGLDNMMHAEPVGKPAIR